jgi:hypothetical protein
MQDSDGMLERKEKEHGEEAEREILSEKRVCQRRSGKIKSWVKGSESKNPGREKTGYWIEGEERRCRMCSAERAIEQYGMDVAKW